MSAFIKFEGIDGSSHRAGYEQWSPVESMSQTVSRPAASGAVNVGRYTSTALAHDVSIAKKLDAASPMLLNYMCNGKPVPTVEIHFCQSIGDDQDTPYFKIKLSNVLVSSVSFSGASDGAPYENVSLNFTKAEWTFTKFDEEGGNDGNVDATWDVEKGKA